MSILVSIEASLYLIQRNFLKAMERSLDTSNFSAFLPPTMSQSVHYFATQSKSGRSTPVTPNPSIEGTVKRLRLFPAPHVKR